MTLSERAAQAREQMLATIDEVCGSCGNSCCHQGTMMGGYDALRLAKGLILAPDLEGRVREGLRSRARELRADLATLERVRALIGQAGLGSEDDLGRLDATLEQWRKFCEFLDSPWPADVESLREMLKFAGIWAQATRAVASFPGGHAALANFAAEGSEFRFRGRRLAPPRCLFHSPDDGCLAGRWKPGKCANFLCAGEPNVLDRLREQFSFDDFVLGNAEVIAPDRVVALVEDELALGRQYAEPKVFLGAAPSVSDLMEEMLREAFGSITVLDLAGVPGGLLVDDWEGLLQDVGEDHGCLVRAPAMTGADLYELAIDVDLRRAEGLPLPFVVMVDRLATDAAAHPMWDGAMMRQPLGALDLFAVSGD